jgi:hypothetical protein
MQTAATGIKALVFLLCLGSWQLGAAQNAQPPAHVTPNEAKNHIGETAVVCGKAVDSKVSRYGIAGHGKPVTFDLDQPAPNQAFYFVTFGTQSDGPQEAVSAYQGKNVCVTGKIANGASGPYILAADRSQIKTESGDK